jgi:choline dehydrogenase
MSSYDYVIVGAGSAGCVLAARLSEDPEVSVAVIEAGGSDDAEEIGLPAAWSELFKGPFDWDFDSEPEPELGYRRIYLPRGKVLGGSSSTNAMIYVRGNPNDFDSWAERAPGWGYQDVLPYFRRSEDNERGPDAYHGTGGPLTVSDGRSNHPLASAFVAAAQQAGHPHNEDFNSGQQDGVGYFQLTQRHGLRCSTSTAFLTPALARPNLTLVLNALAHRVTFVGDHAVGVEISRLGVVETIHAEREVIVSAGAYQTPKLLLLSGLGPGEDLRSLDIPVVADLPVGQGLQDHLAVFVNYLTSAETLMTALNPSSLEQLETEGRGPLTSNLAEAGAFVRTRDDLVAPDVQLHFAPVMSIQENLAAPTAHAVALGPCILTPTSRGRVTLRTPDPGSAPRIQHHYLDTAEDRSTLVSGVRIAMDIAAQPALADLITVPFDVPESGSDADLLAFARAKSFTLYHPTSSCPIGPVVDPDLRVHGVDGLRVVDASVMPSVVRGNTNAATIMIAERAAELIQPPVPAV